MAFDLQTEFVECINRDRVLKKWFQELQLLGWGSEGIVVRAVVRRTQEEVAVKLIKRMDLVGKGQAQKDARKHATRELQNQSRLSHPLIVGYIQAFVSDSYLVIMMEYLRPLTGYGRKPIGSLVDLLKMNTKGGGLDEDIARHYFQQLIVAVDYCHRMKVTNRDIKLEHCLLHVVPGMSHNALPLLKLCDWGHSKSCCTGSSLPGSLVGTPGYWAPEVVINNHANEKYDAYLADVFSCGVILWKLLFGYDEWPSEDVEYERRVHREGKMDQFYSINVNKKMQGLPFKTSGKQPMQISAGCREMLEAMLQPDFKKRRTIKFILDHPWFTHDLPSDAVALNDTVCRADYRDMYSSDIPSPQDLEKLVLHAAGGNIYG